MNRRSDRQPIDEAALNLMLSELRLPAAKTLDSFDFSVVPQLSKAHVSALCAGDRWLDEGANLLLIGPPGTGKSHLAAAIGLALIEHGFRLVFADPEETAAFPPRPPAGLPIGAAAPPWLRGQLPRPGRPCGSTFWG